MMTKEFKKHWKRYEAMVKAIVELFHPFVEAAVHDLSKGSVVALYHNFSQRKVGSASPLTELKVNVEDFPDYFAPYSKVNWDGRPLKCTSITIRDEEGKAIGLICFNADVSLMQNAYKSLGVFLKIEEKAENPIEVFGHQCEEQATATIHQYLDDNRLSMHHLSRDMKRDLVQHLYHKGIFNFKSAAPFVANYLNISRASVYNYIKQIGES